MGTKDSVYFVARVKSYENERFDQYSKLMKDGRSVPKSKIFTSRF